MKPTLALIVLAVPLLSACPKPSAGSIGSRQSPVIACVKAGDSCEVTPGKIGLCTPKDETCQTGAACLTCMSLH